MPIKAVVYASTLVEGVPLEKVDEITADATYFNRLAGVTGVLLFDGQRFVQYFEGPDDGFKAVLDRVRSARSHTNMVELIHGHMPQRLLPAWAMHRITVDSLLLNQLALADWQDFARLGTEKGATPTDQLLRVVEQHRALHLAGTQ
ncbi:BLUF domain-containing protein [Stenotrophomonas sp. C3(2023)]|uniref:BLUF domain-containing protein n=1 Tax=Stenotrophomonas sp. C3(2023) TaxID=3080277 RepID=UPI00293C4193|nr:BLUF domain-containing protein [Stenotrophomonas sp. C3(2023)]MDV3469417.1 BLUF domain-containing protein [Stenotrophomonas sp. C3(2023)]